MRMLTGIILIVLMLSACASDPLSDYKELDLLSYGVPLKVMAPDSAIVKKEDWISQKGVAITKGDDFDILVWKAEATSLDLATLKASKLGDVEANKYFSKIILEEPGGFIFENKLDSNTLFYGFYHLILQGDNEYIIQNGLRGNFTKEQAENMYSAVKVRSVKK